MKIHRNESGQTLVIVAAFMGLIALGFLAFAIDVGLLFRAKRMAQSAADAAALAAAAEVAAGYPSSKQTVAEAMAKLNGFDTKASNPATVVLRTPTSGNFTGSAYIQATVSRPIKTFFLGAFTSGMSTVPVSAQATAGGAKTSQTCVCLEGTSGQVLNVNNASRLQASGCGIVANSSSSNSVGVTNASSLDALTLGLVSSTWNPSYVNNASIITPSTKIIQGLTSLCAPTMPPAPAYATCVKDPGGSWGTHTWGPPNPDGVVCYQGLSVGANGSTDTLNPGIYVIKDNDLHFQVGSGGPNSGGNGVFFYLTGNATLKIDNAASVHLVARSGTTDPSLAAYDGIVVYQERSDATAMSLQGASSTYIRGALYAPSAAITIGNASGGTISGAIDARSLTITNAATLNATADTNQGSVSIGSAKLVQ